MSGNDYREEAQSDSNDMIEYFRDEIVDQLVDSDEASDDFNNDYAGGDSYHHESHVDKPYDLLESAELLDQLRDFEETDSGLWEGCEPRRAIEAQAAFTYGNAVYSMACDLIREINDSFGDFEAPADLPEDEQEVGVDNDQALENAKREFANECVDRAVGKVKS